MNALKENWALFVVVVFSFSKRKYLKTKDKELFLIKRKKVLGRKENKKQEQKNFFKDKRIKKIEDFFSPLFL